MVYLTHYEEYPIYEPAEGGYYYAGVQAVESERMSLNQARKALAQIADELIPEGWERRLNWRPGNSMNCDPGDRIERTSRYIGGGEFWLIERKQGTHEKGWHPYC